MSLRSLGTTALRTGNIGLGCVTFGREITELEACRLLDYAVERGITLLDTAEAYGGGQARAYRRQVLGIDDERECSAEMHSSEKIIGRWLRANGHRSGIIVQTKVSSGFTRSALLDALEGSLERLQTDQIDVYMLHKVDETTPLEECLEALDEAVRARLIRAAGCSNISAERLKNATELSRTRGLAPFQVVQPQYNLLARGIESDLIPLCKANDISVVPYSPLAAGFLSGKYRADSVPPGSRFDVIPGHRDVYFSPRNFDIVRRLHELAARIGVPPTLLALAWTLKNADLTAVLIGARNTAHIDNALAARSLEMQPEWMAEMNSWN